MFGSRGMVKRPRAFPVNTGSLCRRPFGSRSRVSVKVVVAPRPSRNPKDLSQMDPARRVCRWRAPAASGGLGRATSTTCAAFLADRLAIGETERFSIHRKCSKRWGWVGDRAWWRPWWGRDACRRRKRKRAARRERLVSRVWLRRQEISARRRRPRKLNHPTDAGKGSD